MVKRSFFAILISLVIFAVLFTGCTAQSSPAGLDASQTTTPAVSEKEALLVYCGAGMRVPMEEIGTAFEKKSGIPVTYNFANSGQLLAQMELTKKGDIYIPGATLDFENAKSKGFISDEALIAYHVPVIVTPKDNPAGIKTIDDLTKPGVRVALGEVKNIALGIIATKILDKSGIKDEVMSNIVVERATVNELVTDVALGNADAAIVWEDLYRPEDMGIVYIPDEKNIIKVIPAGSLTFSKQPDSAKEFVEFIASDDGGLKIFEAHGFTTYPDEKYGN